MSVMVMDISSNACSVSFILIISVLFIFNVIVPFLCYVVIFRIIRNQSMRMSVRTSSFFHLYKSTSVVILYIINIVVTTMFYFTIVITVTSPRILIFYSSIIYLIYGLANTCSYVLWFKECRLELLRIVVICFPSVSRHIEPMRIQVYNICTLRNIDSG
jgi:hypothetical protein